LWPSEAGGGQAASLRRVASGIFFADTKAPRKEGSFLVQIGGHKKHSWGLWLFRVLVIPCHTISWCLCALPASSSGETVLRKLRFKVKCGGVPIRRSPLDSKAVPSYPLLRWKSTGNPGGVRARGLWVPTLFVTAAHRRKALDEGQHCGYEAEPDEVSGSIWVRGHMRSHDPPLLQIPPSPPFVKAGRRGDFG